MLAAKPISFAKQPIFKTYVVVSTISIGIEMSKKLRLRYNRVYDVLSVLLFPYTLQITSCR